jgi:hypothetical protein
MREVKVMCDRCGHVILENATKLRASGAARRRLPNEEIDLCIDRLDALGNFMRSRELTDAMPRRDD